MQTTSNFRHPGPFDSALALFLLACSDGGGSKEPGAGPDAGGEDANGDPGGASCTGASLPPIADYGSMGPFATIRVNGSGPDGQYSMFRPEVLGADGFRHPVATWGNGIFTSPDEYAPLLTTLASHGFVVIASNSTRVNAALMTAGLEWLLEQDGVSGDLQGKGPRIRKSADQPDSVRGLMV